MNQRQIESFLAVAKEGNFTRAAQNLYISQPAVSKLVSSLEDELGVELLQRRYHKDAQLTEAGKLYYEFFREMSEKLLMVAKEAQKYQESIQGTIRLGILTGWKLQTTLQQVIRNMNQKYPKIDIQLSFADLEPLRHDVQNDKLDFIFTIRDSIRDTGFESMKLADVKRVIFYPAECASRKKTVEDFKDDVFYAVADRKSNSSQLVREYLRPYHFEPRIQLVPNIEEGLARTHSGMGVMVIDEWSREIGNTSLNHIALESSNEAVLAWDEKNKNPVLSYFLKEIQLAFQIQS